MHLAPGNPYFQHAYWQGWIAFKENQPVGRISAQIDRLYLNHHNGETGFFGMLEAIDDGAVFERLFSEAETWLIKQGMRCIQGPFNLSINHECGLLVEGFDRPPVVMMPYNPPYYATQLQRLGYQKVKDLLAYDLDASVEPPAAARNLARKAAQSIHVRPLRRRRLHEEFEILRGIFNDAWADNWGFVPFTREEFADMAGNLRHIIDDDFVQIAELDGEAVGMIVAIPDLNQLFLGLDGRLLPFNWLRLLWRWRTRYPDGGRVILMGVRRRYRQSLLGAAIAYLLVEALRKPVLAKGIRRMELSWILEDNQRMRGVIESLGAVCYKRYRIFTKALT
ncbi:MAG TPA: GNAT family N-acetyltransferase [Methylothermaceae bacterium]|nr:GNAT family N-acetyltransferase [Methylothermaceae bacterium]